MLRRVWRSAERQSLAQVVFPTPPLDERKASEQGQLGRGRGRGRLGRARRRFLPGLNVEVCRDFQRTHGWFGLCEHT